MSPCYPRKARLFSNDTEKKPPTLVTGLIFDPSPNESLCGARGRGFVAFDYVAKTLHAKLYYRRVVIARLKTFSDIHFFFAASIVILLPRTLVPDITTRIFIIDANPNQ